MVVGRLPLYNPDPIDFMDDLVEKEVEIPADLSSALQYPLCFCVFVFVFLCFLTRGICWVGFWIRIQRSGFRSMRFWWGRIERVMRRVMSGCGDASPARGSRGRRSIGAISRRTRCSTRCRCGSRCNRRARSLWER